MDAKFGKPLIPIEQIEDLIQVEPALVIVGMAVIAWLFYKIFLRKVSQERHRVIRRHFSRLLVHLTIFGSSLTGFWLIHSSDSATPFALRILPYLGFLAICWGALVFVKSARINVLQYLFFSHMKEGVPIVLVNSFTLILYLVVFGWLAKEIFHVQVGTLLATSAIFSILLGLALQDTLGNLFSGIALQLDKPFDIGDWVEVSANNQKWVGRVYEISWRATVIIGLSEEWINIPNRVLSQGQVSNFSIQQRPICRRHIFRIPFGVSMEKAKDCIMQACLSVPEVKRNPAPLILADEPTENWLPLKALFFIDDYGNQWSITDAVVARAMRNLSQAGIPLASNRLEIDSKAS